MVTAFSRASVFSGAHQRNNGYKNIGAILGGGGEDYLILPVGDSKYENADRTTVTTVGRGTGKGIDFAYSKSLNDFTLKPIYRPNQLALPDIRTNGVDEQASAPSSSFFNRNDSIGEGFSWLIWLKLTITGTWQRPWSKFGASPLRQWTWEINNSQLTRMYIYDEVNNVIVARNFATILVTNVWYSLVSTYDGRGGANAADGMNNYLNGKLDNGTVINNASYVRMRDTSQIVDFCQNGVPGGTICGGPSGPAITHRVLTDEDQAEWREQCMVCQG